MPISVVCPSCSARLNAPDATAGKTVKCPKCHAAMVIPVVTEAEVAEEPAPAPKRPVRAYVDDDEDDRPRKRRRDDDEDDEDDRPRRRKRAKAGPPAGVLIGAGLAGLLLLGGGGFAVYWFGVRDRGADGGGPKAAVPAGWHEVAPPGAGFKAYMPEVPHNAAMPLNLPPRILAPVKHDYNSPGRNMKIACVVTVIVFPETMAAPERDKYLTERMIEGAPKQFFKDVSSRKSRLGGKEATELVRELDMAALFAQKGPNFPRVGPDGQALPDKIVVVARYMIAGNRAYMAGVIGMGDRPAAADEKGFFDNFELVPATDPRSQP